MLSTFRKALYIDNTLTHLSFILDFKLPETNYLELGFEHPRFPTRRPLGTFNTVSGCEVKVYSYLSASGTDPSKQNRFLTRKALVYNGRIYSSTQLTVPGIDFFALAPASQVYSPINLSVLLNENPFELYPYEFKHRYTHTNWLTGLIQPGIETALYKFLNALEEYFPDRESLNISYHLSTFMWRKVNSDYLDILQKKGVISAESPIPKFIATQLKNPAPSLLYSLSIDLTSQLKTRFKIDSGIKRAAKLLFSRLLKLQNLLSPASGCRSSTEYYRMSSGFPLMSLFNKLRTDNPSALLTALNENAPLLQELSGEYALYFDNPKELIEVVGVLMKLLDRVVLQPYYGGHVSYPTPAAIIEAASFSPMRAHTRTGPSLIDVKILALFNMERLKAMTPEMEHASAHSFTSTDLCTILQHLQQIHAVFQTPPVMYSNLNSLIDFLFSKSTHDAMSLLGFILKYFSHPHFVHFIENDTKTSTPFALSNERVRKAISENILNIAQLLDIYASEMYTVSFAKTSRIAARH